MGRRSHGQVLDPLGASTPGYKSVTKGGGDLYQMTLGLILIFHIYQL